jgi:allantoinase
LKRFGLKSTRVVGAERLGPATVVIADGRVESVETGACGALETRDLGDLVLGPGLVDCHVHLNEPGRTEWEGFATATRAAAAGGVTAVVDMPLNCSPVTTSRAALETKLTACAGQCWVDVGFWGGVVPGNAGALEGLAAAGALGCKAFLVHSGLDEFPNATAQDLRRAMPILKDLGLPLLAHAELELPSPPAPDGDVRAYRTYLASRPAAWEDAAIRLLVELCRETGCAVHIVHLSASSSLPLLRRAKDEGLPITVETCPHYLCLEAEAIPDGATEYKCAPPIRDHENREALWQGLLEGVIDFVISDHSPCLPALKRKEAGDFKEAWGGIASLQLGLSAVWSEARRRGVSEVELARWMSTAPARFAGLAATKGRIAPGYDADFVVWDPDARFTVAASRLFFRHPVSPYLGQTLAGVVRETWLRGHRVFDDKDHSSPASGVVLRGRQAA